MAVKNYGIHDKWTDLDKLNNVDIKSVDGVIESVKINGEEAGGGGSSDFSTARVTVVNNYTKSVDIYVALADSEYLHSDTLTNLEPNRTATITAILYKGAAFATITPTVITDAFSVETEGDADADGGDVSITGDCTITIS